MTAFFLSYSPPELPVSPPILITSHSTSSTHSLLNFPGNSHHSYTAGPAAAAAGGCEEPPEVISPGAAGLVSPFLNRIMGMCGLTVTNLRRMERFAETEDIFEGCPH